MKSISMTLEQLLGTGHSRQRAPVMGDRELDVMKILWRDGALSAQAVLDASGESNLSLSTIQSTLERLHRKALVARQKTGRYYLYRATVSRSAIISQLLGDIAEQFSEGDMQPMISGFMSFIGKEQQSQLEDEALLSESILKAMKASVGEKNE